jgi:hypothetical protein
MFYCLSFPIHVLKKIKPNGGTKRPQKRTQKKGHQQTPHKKSNRKVIDRVDRRRYGVGRAGADANVIPVVIGVHQIELNKTAAF